ncbi:hypothetical protein N0V88_001305 [Collariella sp. IMI 366227]|nr:hypothetical protein N0V88_001305 [Collariella sp. IMI 366227]
MVNRIIFWTGFGFVVRFWQLGIEMRPFFTRQALWAYPVFGGVGASFGYWMQGVDERQTKMLQDSGSGHGRAEASAAAAAPSEVAA